MNAAATAQTGKPSRSSAGGRAKARAPRAAEPPEPPILWSEIDQYAGDVTSLVGRRPLAWQVDPRRPRPPILALDIAASGGWCALGDGGYRAGKLVTKAGITYGWAQALEDILSTQTPHASLILVEDTHLGSAHRTPLAAMAVSRYVGAVVAIAALAGFPVLRVQASVWQSKVLGKHKRDAGKTLAWQTARLHFGGAITSEDVADAACLALWARGGRP